MMNNVFLIPPVFIMFIGAIVMPLLPRMLRSIAFIFTTLGALAIIVTLPDGLEYKMQFMMYELILIKADSLSKIFGFIFALIAAAGGIYSYHLKEAGQKSAALLYSGSAIGVTFAGDFFTLFFFWEIMAFASAYLVWANKTKESDKAGYRYLITHVFGGSLLLTGILLHVQQTGSFEVSLIENNGSLSSWLILAGVALNAALPPLHAWLPDAYPRATVTGAVFLSSFTTKSAVYVLARMFAGWEVLIYLGTIMAIYGVLYAVIVSDIREILAYHIVSQVGYMVTGVGIGTALALNGTVAHAFSHILYKALLFMGAGAVLYSTGKSNMTQLGGLGRFMKATVVLYMVGAFSISGFPLFNGFTSKSLIIAGASEAHLDAVMMLLLAVSIGTFLSTGLKLPYFTWFWRDPVTKPHRPVPMNMILGMGLVAFLCLLFGVYPDLLYRFLPYDAEYDPYNWYHLTESVQILVFTFFGFWILRKMLHPHTEIALDIDWFYRRPVKIYKWIFVELTDIIYRNTEKLIQTTATKVAAWGQNPFTLSADRESDEEYTPDKYRPLTGYMVNTVLVLFLTAVGLGLFFYL